MLAVYAAILQLNGEPFTAEKLRVSVESRGLLSGALRRLREEGIIEKVGKQKRDRNVYRLTGASARDSTSRAFFTSLKKDWEEFVRGAGSSYEEDEGKTKTKQLCKQALTALIAVCTDHIMQFAEILGIC